MWPGESSARRSTRSSEPRRRVPMPRSVASLGCGVPTAVADLHEGETVLDLGSGAGADVLISARRVGPTGRADRPRHDRRDARPRPRQRRARPASRTSSSSRATSRTCPLPDAQRRRRHLQLRDQPLRRQARRHPRSRPRPAARRTLRRLRRRSPTPTWTRPPARTWPHGPAASPAPSPRTNSAASLERRRLRGHRDPTHPPGPRARMPPRSSAPASPPRPAAAARAGKPPAASQPPRPTAAASHPPAAPAAASRPQPEAGFAALSVHTCGGSLRARIGSPRTRWR